MTEFDRISAISISATWQELEIKGGKAKGAFLDG